MDNKKFNIFAAVLVVVMAIFSIYMGIVKNNANDGRDGLSAYELAVLNGEFSGTEFEYLQSLHGKDGSNITLEDIYKAYLKEKNWTSSDYTFSEFILTFYPDNLLDADETATLVQSSTASALRSTVDICYSFYMNNPIVYVSETTTSDSKSVYKINESADYYNKYTAIGVSAGSGVIYKIDEGDSGDTSDDVAYIITNYHVVYANNFTNDETNYRVYFDQTTEEYFTATYDETKIGEDTKQVSSGFPFGQVYNETYHYLEKTDVVDAPIQTHFLKEYSIYLYGYQSSAYEISASFVGGSADNDIAVLKVERNKSANNARLFDGNYKAVDLGDSKDLDEGETVIAVGNPLLVDTSGVNNKNGVEAYVNGLKQSYVDKLCLTSTSGELSNISEYTKFQSLLDSSKAVDMRLMRVSAAINAGNSGGGLYDINGKLIGIVNGKIVSNEYDNVGFAIPINIASRLADRIIAECDGTTTRINALREAGTGFNIKVKNSVSETYFDPNIAGGSWVRKNNVVVESSSVAGISADMIISAISFDDSQVKYELTNEYDFNDILLMAKKGTTTKVVFHILGAGNVTTPVEITLTNAMYSEII